jgi:hypothetical protein
MKTTMREHYLKFSNYLYRNPRLLKRTAEMSLTLATFKMSDNLPIQLRPKKLKMMTKF